MILSVKSFPKINHQGQHCMRVISLLYRIKFTNSMMQWVIELPFCPPNCLMSILSVRYCISHLMTIYLKQLRPSLFLVLFNCKYFTFSLTLSSPSYSVLICPHKVQLMCLFLLWYHQATFNTPKYIIRCVESCLRPHVHVMEIMIGLEFVNFHKGKEGLWKTLICKHIGLWAWPTNYIWPTFQCFCAGTSLLM